MDSSQDLPMLSGEKIRICLVSKKSLVAFWQLILHTANAHKRCYATKWLQRLEIKRLLSLYDVCIIYYCSNSKRLSSLILFYKLYSSL